MFMTEPRDFQRRGSPLYRRCRQRSRYTEEIPSALPRIVLGNRVRRNHQPWLRSKEIASWCNFNSSIIPHCPVRRYYLCSGARCALCTPFTDSSLLQFACVVFIFHKRHQLMGERASLFRLRIKRQQIESVLVAYLVSRTRDKRFLSLLPPSFGRHAEASRPPRESPAENANR